MLFSLNNLGPTRLDVFSFVISTYNSLTCLLVAACSGVGRVCACPCRSAVFGARKRCRYLDGHASVSRA